MIGPKKLSQIRDEIGQSIAKDGTDPIQWLEERMSGPGKAPEVLKSLVKVLKSHRKSTRSASRS